MAVTTGGSIWFGKLSNRMTSTQRSVGTNGQFPWVGSTTELPFVTCPVRNGLGKICAERLGSSVSCCAIKVDEETALVTNNNVPIRALRNVEVAQLKGLHMLANREGDAPAEP